jgi:putative MATE family efflux protein
MVSCALGVLLMRVSLSDHFTYGRIAHFTLPSVLMLLCSSIYSIVDGLFVANIVGRNGLSAINIIMPLPMFIGAFGYMLGAGGSAEVSKKLGEGRRKTAEAYFSLVVLAVVLVGALLTFLGVMFIRPIARMMGASDILMEDAVTYGRILVIGSVAYLLQTTFQMFFVTAGKPRLGFLFSIAAGLTNVLFDFLFIVVFGLGIAGAAWATVLGYAVGGVLPLVYFFSHNRSLLHLRRPQWDAAMLKHSCSNGYSEMLSSFSASLLAFLYNNQMMRLAGEAGVASMTVLDYMNSIFVSIFVGFSMGIAPVVGFHFGAGNKKELSSLFKKCLVMIGGMSLSMTVFAEVFAPTIVRLFLGQGNAVSAMTVRGFRMYAFSYLLCGLPVFGSSFFTALCDGKTSAIISSTRSLIAEPIAIILLPFLIGLDGVWLSVYAAETVAAVVTIHAFVAKRRVFLPQRVFGDEVVASQTEQAVAD